MNIYPDMVYKLQIYCMNIVVLIAAISVYNSCVYSNSRMLLGLAEQGNAPKLLKHVNARGIPVYALYASAMVTALCVLLNYLMPEKAFNLLMMLVVAALVINWLMISITDLKFRQYMLTAGRKPIFKSLGAPFTNYITIAFVFFILLMMSYTSEMRIAVFLVPVWLGILYIFYRFKAPVNKMTESVLDQ